MAKAREKSKTPKRKRLRPLPHLAAALFCERQIEDKDGLSTLVRIMDVMTIVPPDSWPTEIEKEKIATPVFAFLSFKSGEAKGEYKLRVDVIRPSGKRDSMSEATLNFLGDGSGVNVRANVVAPIAQEGLYWYEVFVDDVLMTRMPLQIRHEPKAQQQPESGAKPKKKG